MSNDIKIKKGLNIKLRGEAEKTIENAIISNFYTLRPEDFHGIIPKLIVKVGAKVKAGEPVFYSKSNEAIKFVSPVSGEVVDIQRGEKRKILAVKIQADKEQVYQDYDKLKVLITKYFYQKIRPVYQLRRIDGSCFVIYTYLCNS